jgi:DNA-binding CsgD family transcriptional regulator
MKLSDNSAADHELVEELSERELEILDLMAENLTNQEIADNLILSLNTVKWYARQIYEKLGVDNRRAAVRKGVDLDLIETDQERDTAPTHNLPAQLTPFWGRERELAELTQLISDPACRLLTITGHGGMGKTRVALQLATTILHNQPTLFPAGIFFVSLAEATDLADLVSAIATALGFRFYQGAVPPEKQLSQFLQPKQGLILLDNLEGLISPDNVRYVTRLLAEASGLKIMATSRVPLRSAREYS